MPSKRTHRLLDHSTNHSMDMEPPEWEGSITFTKPISQPYAQRFWDRGDLSCTNFDLSERKNKAQKPKVSIQELNRAPVRKQGK